ncbi:MAG: hypothetical protein A2X94_11460 [Bdellovibrionales bacterium GWB1_55_8]|nr:MAG: hypothetical protein A2X94_11460 [Bdellovibrionales bacterium GWB1_55_8]
MKNILILSLALAMTAPAVAAQKAHKIIGGKKFTIQKSETRGPASAEDDVNVLQAYLSPAYVAFAKNAKKLKFSKDSLESLLDEDKNLSPASYFKKYTLNEAEGDAGKVEKFIHASCEAAKKGIRKCSLSILFEQHEKTDDTPSGHEIFESSAGFLFSIDAKGNVVGNVVNFFMAG